MVLGFGLLAAFIIALTANQTANVYSSLPERVVLGFYWDGTPRSFAPRPFIWMLVVVQCFILGVEAAAATAIVRGAPNVHGTVTSVAIISVALSAILWQAQRQLIKSSLDPQARPGASFWTTIIVGMAVVGISAAFA